MLKEVSVVIASSTDVEAAPVKLRTGVKAGPQSKDRPCGSDGKGRKSPGSSLCRYGF